MKSVLISIQPKWCELIANGKKTIEVRKSAPKIETPFKVYICCTKETRANAIHLYINGENGRQKFGITDHMRGGKEIVDVNPHLPCYGFNSYLAEGKVIGEFVCDKVITVDCDSVAPFDPETHEYIQGATCLDRTAFVRYTNFRKAFGWLISDLKIYDKPKALKEFGALIRTRDWERGTEHFYVNGKWYKPMKKSPQSWCYVEELKNEI